VETARKKIRIAVDAMGGDYAPQNVIAGAFEALRESNNGFEVILVGPEPKLRDALKNDPGLKGNETGMTIVHASDVIDMEDTATSSIRGKKESSISVGMTLQPEGKADAFVSAGHTGAVMTASTLILGRIPGVTRPTIGTFLPTVSGFCLLVDSGTNVDCKPQHLYEFAAMGSIYIREMMGIDSPKVGLLNVGEEETKGNDAVKEAYKLLKESRLNFIGNVEGRDILDGKAHVAVCDGFTGNVLLKFAESIPSFLKSVVKEAARKSAFTMLLGGLMRNTLRSALKTLDYEEYGGVPVLGVNGISIIGHGSSSPKAFKNMIITAQEMVTKQINKRIAESLGAVAQ
jgi:glycerol-3-phosphate acyltransferase PlsX